MKIMTARPLYHFINSRKRTEIKKSASGPALCRVCSKCKRLKPIVDFSTQNDRKSGLSSQCRQCQNRRVVAYNQSQCIFAYMKLGGCKCVLCGCQELRFLTIDHINGGGSKHRRFLRKNRVYQAVINDKNPKRWARVLCFNCNCSLVRFNNDETLLKRANKQERQRIRKEK